jgi:hypothetical protein
VTKALTYVEIDVPAIVPTLVHQAFDEVSSSPHLYPDTNTVGSTHVWTPAGDVSLSSPCSFGNGELHVQGTGYISTPDSVDFSFGSNDFSIEFYFWNDSAIGAERNFCGQRAGVGGANTTRAWNIDIQPSGVISAKVFQGSTQILCNGTTTFGASTRYHHVALTRYGGLLMLFVDGVMEASTAIAGAINDSTGTLAIGRDGDDTSALYNGWIDEFTIHPYARRTGNFVPTPTRFPSVTPPIALTVATMLRFAIDAGYLPRDIDAIPSLLEVKIDPATVSLGENIGTRATVTCKFRDHRHVLDAEPFTQGSFWGKFRARYGLKLQGRALRVITGALGQALAAMEIRNFIIESVDGPSTKGEYQIIAKDVLKLADGDRAQAPTLSPGFLSANITNVATSATLLPAGIGNSSYPASGFLQIDGSEICSFTRSGDTLTLTRGQKNTTAVAHNAQGRVQVVLQYTSADPATIIRDLLVTYAAVPSSYIDLTAWQAEVAGYLSTVYTATITEPKSVADLVSELVEQVGLVIWWDSINQKIRLLVLRPIPSGADVFDHQNFMADSLEVKEQPEKRLSQVYTYFAKINPLINDDQENNYRSTSFQRDATAEAAYGTPAIKKIYSRWIPDGGRSVADSIGTVQLARYRDPPRRISFNMLRGSVATPLLGTGYQIGSWIFQTAIGLPITIPAQITRLNPRADFFEIEAEEISLTGFAAASPGDHTIIIDANLMNVNLRTMHDSIYGTPVAGNTVTCTINAGVIVGSTSAGVPAFDVGTWPAGVTIQVIVNGRIQGKGGAGGNGAAVTAGTGGTGGTGGTALKTTVAILLTVNQIWAGGGGGGGNGGNGTVVGAQTFYGAAGGGGGAGTNGGAGGIHSNGVSGINGNDGSAGTPTAGGAGGTQTQGAVGFAGAGGGPGLAGSVGSAGSGAGAGAGGGAGARGAAINGVSFVTFVGGSPSGDIRGSQIN